jgi:serine/threonine-protein kinase
MHSPTLTAHATVLGVILGTAAYMAPEQAKGKVVDRRADIWAFGAVLYEVLSGQRAFKGEDISDTLAAVLRQDIDWTALPASTPASVRRLLARCLDRDIRRRLRDIGEARILLDDPATGESGDARGVPVLAPLQPLWRRAIPAMLAAIVTGVLVGGAWFVSLRPSTPLAVTRFSLSLPEGQVFSAIASPRRLIALSPDGTQMAFVGYPSRLYIRSMSQLDVKAVQGIEGFTGVSDPVFSPDGQWVAFYAFADQTLKKITVAGGAPVTICPAESPFGISWDRDAIVFGQGSKGIMRVSANGGQPAVLVGVNEGEAAHGPQVLPGGQHVLFTLATGTGPGRWDNAHIVVQSLASGERKTLIVGGSDARYLPTGHLVYAVGGTVFAVAFDARRLELRSGPVPMVEGVRRAAGLAGGGTTGAAHFSVSSTGSLAYIPGPVSASPGLMDVVLGDRTGGIERLKIAPGQYLMPRASPDGTRIAIGTDDGKEAIIYTFDLTGTGTMQRLTFGGNNRFPVWSSDSNHVAFQSDREGDLAIFWQTADGKEPAKRLTKPESGSSHVPESWSPKGDRLLFSISKGPDVWLWTFWLDEGKATPFGDVHSSNPIGAVFSPDGRWVAYTSTERSLSTVYVQPFPATGAKFQLFAKGDNPHEVVWSPDGKALFYNPRPGGFESVSVTTEPTFTFGNAVAVPKGFQLGPAISRRAYDITPGGKFVGLIATGQQSASDITAAAQIQVVLNWAEELKRLVPMK